MAKPTTDAEFQARLEALEKKAEARKGSEHGKRDLEAAELIRYCAEKAGVVFS